MSSISEGLKRYWASAQAAGRRAKASAKKAADRDGDGKLTRNDIKTGAKQVGAAVSGAIREGRARLQGRSSKNNTMKANDGPQATTAQRRIAGARTAVRSAGRRVAGAARTGIASARASRQERASDNAAIQSYRDRNSAIRGAAAVAANNAAAGSGTGQRLIERARNSAPGRALSRARAATRSRSGNL